MVPGMGSPERDGTSGFKFIDRKGGVDAPVGGLAFQGISGEDVRVSIGHIILQGSLDWASEALQGAFRGERFASPVNPAENQKLNITHLSLLIM
jgi:hypothetical protein